MSTSRQSVFFLRHPLIVAIFATLLVTLASRSASHSPYAYDEADYMYATKLGLAANYSDTPTMPFPEFLRTGLGRGLISPPMQLSEMIRGSNDVVFYRHWHGPLYFYSLMLISQFRLDEYRMRLSTLAFAVCSLLMIYLGGIWVLGGEQGALAAILGSALFVWSSATVRSLELAPHQAFACCSLACLFLLSKAAATGNRRYFYWAVIAAALGCCLLEVGLILVTTCIVCGYMERRNLVADRVLTTHSSLAFVITILLVWPGAIAKLSLMKGYLFMAYLALFRKSPWGTESFYATWEKRIYNSPLEWLVIGASLLAWIICRWPESDRRALYPFLVYGAFMLAATVQVTTGAPRYCLVFQPALDVLAGFILAGYLSKIRRPITAYALVAVLSLALFAETWVNLRRQPAIDDTRLLSLLAFIKENRLETSRLLVPQVDLPTLHYYFPQSHLQGYTDREPMTSKARHSGADGLLYPGFPIRYEPLARREFN